MRVSEVALSSLGRILTLVACVPLLLPPSLCVCKASDTDGTLPSPSKAARTIVQTTPHKSEGCSHRHATPDHHTDEAPGDPPSHEPAPRAPHDHQHSPGCPVASPAVERFQWSEPTPGVPLAVLPATFSVSLELAVAASRPTDRVGTHRAVSPPLYLSHCSLVI